MADQWSRLSGCAAPQELVLKGRCMTKQQFSLPGYMEREENGSSRCSYSQSLNPASIQCRTRVVPYPLQVKSHLVRRGTREKMVFMEKKKSLPSRCLGQPTRITNLPGNPFFMASEKVILLVTAQKDWLK